LLFHSVVAVGGVQPGARHGNLDRPKRAGQRPRTAAVPVAGNDRTFFIASNLASHVTGAAKHGVELAADHLFDQLNAPERAPRSRADQTSCRKDQQPSRLQAAKNRAS
jgi:hypothetical protein